MKNYKEMAKDLFARREEYEKQKKRKKIQRRKVELCAAGIGVVMVTGLGIWKSGIVSLNSNQMQVAESQTKEEAEKTPMEQEKEKIALKKPYRGTENITKKETGEERTTLQDTESASKKKRNIEEGEDKTVKPVNSINLKEEYNQTIVEETKVSDAIDVNWGKHDLDTLSKDAKEIVAGKVQKITYDMVESLIWTKTDIKITDTWKGELKKNDIISVYRLGGCISYEEYEKYNKDVARFKVDKEESKHTLLKMVYWGEEFPKVGKESVFYLEPTSSESSLPDGAYERIKGKYAELRVRSDGKLQQYLDNDTKLYTWKEVKEKAEKWKK